MENLNKALPGSRAVTVMRPMGEVGPVQSGYSNAYNIEGADKDDSDGELLEYWRIVRRYKKMIAGFALLGGLIGVLVTVPQPPVYRVATSLEVLNLNQDFMNMRQSSPVSTTNDSDETSEEETQVKLLESSALMDRVLAKLDNGKPLGAIKSVIPDSGWRSIFKVPQGQAIDPYEGQLLGIAGSLNVSVTPRTRVIGLTMDSTNPTLALAFANTLTSEFVQMNLEARWDTSHSTGNWLTKELDDTRKKLQASEDALQSYAKDSGLIFTSDSNNVATEKLQQIQRELSAASAERITKQSRFELAKSARPDSLADVLSDGGLRETQSKMNDLKRQIADLTAVYAPDYIKVTEAQAQLAALETAFNRQRSDVVARISNDYIEATRKEQLLNSAYYAQTHEVSGQGEKAIQYNILKREVDSNRQLYDAMLQQMKQSSIASAMRASNVRIVDPAKMLSRPVSPNIKLNAGLGLLSGLLLGVAFSLLRERADRTLQQPGDIKLWTNLPELGSIPTASFQRGRSYNALKAGKEEFEATTEGLQLTTTKSSALPELVEMTSRSSKASPIAEAFRSVLTSILMVGSPALRPRLIVVTSASPADGKTTVVTNLALALASIRRKVLVIDADLRRPRMHLLFALNNDMGMADLLASEEFDESQVLPTIQMTETPGLHVLTSGPLGSQGANLLYSPNLEKLLVTCRGHYDMVLVDTPPMLQMTDARIVGRLSDGMILVSRAGKTTRDALKAVGARLQEDGCPILGTILNDWNPKTASRGYYGDYYAKYSYYQHSRDVVDVKSNS